MQEKQVMNEKAPIVNRVLQDNGHILFGYLVKTRKVFFMRTTINDTVYYTAGNRAARRVLQSNRFQNKAKNLGLEVELDIHTVA